MLTEQFYKMSKFFSCCYPNKEAKENIDGRKKRKRMVIVGDGACGKTALVMRMTTGKFVGIGYIPTVFETEMMEVNTGKETVELVIFDTAGQEDYDRLRPFSYNDIDVVLICFSLADSDTLLNVMANWVPEIRYYCKNAPVILVGNKKDLRDPECSSSTNSLTAVTEFQQHASEIHEGTDKQTSTIISSQSSQLSPFNDLSKPVYKVNAPVKHSEGALIASRIGAMAYFETSAVTGENVEELLLATTKAAVLGIDKSRKFRPFTETLKSWKSLHAINSKKCK